MVQDQVSARLAPEHFTIGHAPIRFVTTPTVLGLTWGFLAGFPGGIVLGLMLAATSTLGPWPPLAMPRLRWPLLLFFSLVAASTLVAGGSAAYVVDVVPITLAAPWASVIPPIRHQAFFIVACAHTGTYVGGGVTGIGVCVWILWTRRQAARAMRHHTAAGALPRSSHV